MNATEFCSTLTKRSRSNFYYSFLLLSPLQREAMHVLYAFCRNTDNIVDEIGDHTAKSVKLKEWAAELVNALHGQSAIPLLNQLRDVIRQFAIPSEYCFELIKGVEMDLAKTRYRTFEELYRYCYRVASTVGLMSIRIFGSQSEKAKGYAYLKHLSDVGYKMRRPFADYLGEKTGLYELRPGRHRVLYFFFVRNKVILLHAFLKKTDAIPIKDIDIALHRKEICQVLLKFNKVDFDE